MTGFMPMTLKKRSLLLIEGTLRTSLNFSAIVVSPVSAISMVCAKPSSPVTDAFSWWDPPGTSVVRKGVMPTNLRSTNTDAPGTSLSIIRVGPAGGDAAGSGAAGSALRALGLRAAGASAGGSGSAGFTAGGQQQGQDEEGRHHGDSSGAGEQVKRQEVLPV